MQALIVIDMQCGMFADTAMPPHDGAAVLTRIAELIGAARAAGAPVIFIQHDGGAGDILARDQPGFALHPALAPRPGEPIIVKTFCDAFQQTPLAETLAGQKIHQVILCGMQTEFCIDTTCRAAFARGLTVTLAGDAHTTFDNEILSAATIIRHHNQTLGSGFAAVRPAAAISW